MVFAWTICRSVSRSTKVSCDETADLILMPFGLMSGVGQGMSVLDFGGDRRKGRGSFRGEFGASHCKQWGLC